MPPHEATRRLRRCSAPTEDISPELRLPAPTTTSRRRMRKQPNKISPRIFSGVLGSAVLSQSRLRIGRCVDHLFVLFVPGSFLVASHFPLAGLYISLPPRSHLHFIISLRPARMPTPFHCPKIPVCYESAGLVGAHVRTTAMVCGQLLCEAGFEPSTTDFTLLVLSGAACMRAMRHGLFRPQRRKSTNMEHGHML